MLYMAERACLILGFTMVMFHMAEHRDNISYGGKDLLAIGVVRRGCMMDLENTRVAASNPEPLDEASFYVGNCRGIVVGCALGCRGRRIAVGKGRGDVGRHSRSCPRGRSEELEAMPAFERRRASHGAPHFA